MRGSSTWGVSHPRCPHQEGMGGSLLRTRDPQNRRWVYRGPRGQGRCLVCPPGGSQGPRSGDVQLFGAQPRPCGPGTALSLQVLSAATTPAPPQASSRDHREADNCALPVAGHTRPREPSLSLSAGSCPSLRVLGGSPSPAAPAHASTPRTRQGHCRDFSTRRPCPSLRWLVSSVTVGLGGVPFPARNPSGTHFTFFFFFFGNCESGSLAEAFLAFFFFSFFSLSFFSEGRKETS